MSSNLKLPIDKPVSAIDAFETALDLSLQNYKYIFNATIKPASVFLVASIFLQYCFSLLLKTIMYSTDNQNVFGSQFDFIAHSAFNFIAILVLFVILIFALWFWFLKQLAVTKFICGFAKSVEEAQKTVDNSQWQLVIFNFIAFVSYIIIFSLHILLSILVASYFFKILMSPLNIIFVVLIYALLILNVLFMSNIIIAGNIIYCFERANWKRFLRILFLFTKNYWWKMILAHAVYFICLIPISTAMVSPMSIIGACIQAFSFHGFKASNYEPNFLLSISHGIVQTLIHFYSISVIVFLYGILYLSFKIKYCGFDILNKLDVIATKD